MRGSVPWGTDLAATVAEFGSTEAVSDGTSAITLAALAGKAARLALVLRECSIAPGTPVASCLRNSVPAVWAAMGLRLAGVAETGLSPSYTEAELRYSLDLAGVRLVVTTAAQAALFRALGRKVIAVEDVPDAPADPAALPPVPGDAWGRIGFTSGTTGRPKAIVTSHAARWIGNILQRAHLDSMPGPGARVLLMTPFIHGAGIITHAFHDRGAGVVLLDGVNLPQVERVIGEVDHIFAPPTVMAKLVATFEGRRFSHIRTVFCGTAPLLPAVYAKARAIFGPVVRVTYGKSEINNPITILPPRALDAYYAEPDPGEGVCVGWPGAGVEIEVHGEAGASLPPGEVGEVFLRGRHMYCGHIDTEGFHSLPPDGFHATGDLGRFDARGRLCLVGRMADVIKSGGYKIHPDEIERALAGTAGSGAGVAVVTLPSEYWGEVIVAVAEADDPGWPERARAALAELARHKHPRAFVTLPELARNPQGKIMRRVVREAVLARWRLIDGPHPVLEPVGRP